MVSKIKRILLILLIIVIVLVLGCLIIKYVPFSTQTALESSRGLPSLAGQPGVPSI